MKKKKVIAREFLIFISCIAISASTFLFFLIDNNLKTPEINSFVFKSRAQNKIADSLSAKLVEKRSNQKWFVNKFVNHFNLSFTDSTYKTVWRRFADRANSGRLEFSSNQRGREFVEFLEKIGFKNEEDFKRYLIANTFNNQEIKDYNQSITEGNRAKELLEHARFLESKKHTFSEQITFFKYFLIAIFILFFPVRYLIMGLFWSIRTLRSKDES